MTPTKEQIAKLKDVDIMNLELYKKSHENLEKLLKKLVKTLPSNVLIGELKRRKLIGFDWNDKKYKSKEEINEIEKK